MTIYRKLMREFESPSNTVRYVDIDYYLST
jgi:hypothetical protein